jgi:hypothetical protein
MLVRWPYLDRTNQGLYGWMRLNKFNAENKALTIEFLTWANPYP